MKFKNIDVYYLTNLNIRKKNGGEGGRERGMDGDEEGRRGEKVKSDDWWWGEGVMIQCVVCRIEEKLMQLRQGRTQSMPHQIKSNQIESSTCLNPHPLIPNHIFLHFSLLISFLLIFFFT